MSGREFVTVADLAKIVKRDGRRKDAAAMPGYTPGFSAGGWNM